jgi:hypothetical protein
MTIDLATRLGNTFISAVTPPVPAVRLVSTVRQPGLWRKLAHAVFQAPGRFMAGLARRQAERDALIRYAMAEGRKQGVGRNDIERAVLLTGRADMLFPSYFVNAQRR